MRPDSSAIDAALVATLQSDAVLRELLPDGVFMDEAKPEATRFIVLTLLEEADLAEFGRRAFEDAHYVIKAVALASTQVDMRRAAQRIDELLEDQPLAVPGYAWITTYREERIRVLEVDEIDPSIRWLHRGGQYRVMYAVQ